MRSLIASIAAASATFALAGIGHAEPDPNPAVNNPDKQSWELFMTVNTAASGPNNNNAVFETWASDGDTFKPTPAWPVGQPQVEIGERALGLVLRRAHPRISPQVLPGGRDLVGEETRRNRPDFDFIVNNNLFRVSGLEAAFQAGKPIAFPVDSIEVKANWVAVDRLKEFNGFDGSPAEAAKAYHVNSADGKPYALVSFHIISKLVPNWTWATFEHKDNPGRCDVIGCRDTFGAATQDVAPLSPVESSTHYPDCAKTPEVLALFAHARIDPAFVNYCLKGSQADFTDSSGLAVRVGNSVTENGFVSQASCMSCHARAAFDTSGHASSFAGFDPTSIARPNDTGNAPLGPISADWFFVAGGPPSFPRTVNEANLDRFALPADFVWSVPFCAIDDKAEPPETKSHYCSRK